MLLMTPKNDREVSLADVKQLLGRFAASRTNEPLKVVELEYGDLLLYLIRLADKAGVDLMTGANRALDRRARVMPRPADHNP
jgi:hypothetical protein